MDKWERGTVSHARYGDRLFFYNRKSSMYRRYKACPQLSIEWNTKTICFLLILNKPSKNELTVANTHWVKHESYITFSLTFRCRAIILFYFIFSTGTRQLIQGQVDGDKHTWCETQTLHRIITRWKLQFKKTISFVSLSVERHPSMIQLLTSNNHTVKHKHEHPCSKTFYPSPMIITLNIN